MLPGLAGHVLLAAEQRSQSEVADYNTGQEEGDERVAQEEDTSQAEHRMVFLGNLGQAESPAGRSADLEGADKSTDMDSVDT